MWGAPIPAFLGIQLTRGGGSLCTREEGGCTEFCGRGQEGAGGSRVWCRAAGRAGEGAVAAAGEARTLTRQNPAP